MDRMDWFFSMTAAVALSLVACGRQPDPGEDILPGRSRPLLAHDWTHPRDLQFAPSSFTAPDPAAALVQMKSGLRAYLIPSSSDPVVRITAAMPLGRFYEKPVEAGASKLLADLLTRHGPSDENRSFSMRLAAMGTELQVEESLDVMKIALEVLPEDWREGLSTMMDILRRSQFDPSIIGRYRTGSGYGTPTSGVAGDGFRPRVELERKLAGYPMAPPEPGQPVTDEAVRALAERTLRADRVVLGIGGNIPRDEVVASLNELSDGWEKASEPLEIAQLVERNQGGPALHTIDLPILEGWIAMGRTIGSVPESERAAVQVMANIMETRLNIAAREIRGLANKTAFFLPDTASGAGLLYVGTGGRPEAVGPLVKYCLEEIKRMHDANEPISERELRRAKGALTLGSWQAALDGARQASGTYAVETVRAGSVDRFLKGPEAVNAVTAQHVKDVAKKYLNPSDMVTVVIGPLGKIRQARHPRWPVDFRTLEASPTS